MFHKFRWSVFSIAVILALLVSAFPLGAVMAEGEDPAPVEVPQTEEQLTATEAPAPAEAPQTEEQSTATEAPLSEVEAPPLTVEEVVAQVPEEVVVVPVDPAGEVLTLAEEATASALVSGDPVFCPGGVPWGDPTCVHYATIDEAISAVYDVDHGTVYVEVDYTDLTPEPIIIDGSNCLDCVYKNLTLIGGVDFSTGNVVGKTTLYRRMVVTDMRFFTMQNFILNGVVEALPDSPEEQATPEAALFVDGPDSVDISNSEFSNNAGAGLKLQNVYFASLWGVKANNNGAGNTVESINTYVYHSQFNNNHGTGLTVHSVGEIFLICNQANNNTGVDTQFPEIGAGGMYLQTSKWNTSGDITVWCSKFLGNSSYGLVADTSYGTIYTASNQISGNGLIDFVPISQYEVVEQSAPCSEFCPSCSGGSGGEEETPAESITQVVIVKVGEGDGTAEIKPGYSTVFKLFDQDRLVQLTALASGSAPDGSSAVYTPLDEGALPAPLPEGTELIPWGFNLAITNPDGTSVESLIGYMMIRFYLPEGFVLPFGMHLVIQYFDPATSSWTPMSTAVGGGMAYTFASKPGTYALTMEPIQ
jgi:hypothetical protein